MNYEEIAHKIGVANKGAAFKMVQRGIDGVLTESAEGYFPLEVLRLDCIFTEIYHRLGPESLRAPGSLQLIRNLVQTGELITELISRADLPSVGMSLDTVDEMVEELSLGELVGVYMYRLDQLTRHNLRTAGAAHAATGVQAQRDRKAALLRKEGRTFSAIAAEMGVANRSVAAKMVDRGARMSMASSVKSFVAEHQADLRRLELDLLGDLLNRDLDARTWSRKVGLYIQASRRRCRLLGLFPSPKRKLRSDAPGPSSHDIEVEEMETLLTLAIWRRRGSPSADRSVAQAS